MRTRSSILDNTYYPVLKSGSKLFHVPSTSQRSLTQVLLTELDRYIRRPAVKEVIHDRLQRRGRHRWTHVVPQLRQRNRVARRLAGQQRGRRSVGRDRR